MNSTAAKTAELIANTPGPIPGPLDTAEQKIAYAAECVAYAVDHGVAVEDEDATVAALVIYLANL